MPTPFSARSCRGISLNHMSSTGFSRIKPECAPQFLTRALFHGVPLTRQQTTTAGSTRGGILYLTERIHRLLLKVSHGWVPIAGCPLAVTDLADNATPHFYIHQHKGLLFHGALNITWDQLFDRNCTSLCTQHCF